MRRYQRILGDGLAVFLFCALLMAGLLAFPSGDSPPDPSEEMIAIPAGSFWMGARADDHRASKDEKPRHRVTLDAFSIDRTEVTYLAYQQFLTGLETAGHRFCHPDEPRSEVHAPETHRLYITAMDRPVIGVDWYDAFAYCNWAGKRLPTEAEWERAARGDDERLYPWGNEWDPQRANSDGKADGFRTIAPVGSFPTGASPYGVLDMAGNVWEWVNDSYDAKYYRDSPERNPTGAELHWFKVVRGGSWTDLARDLRSSNRERRVRYAPTRRYDYVGFRCARDGDSDSGS
jgi:formylglycine-generating enzyme required for sulfatase activity